MFRKSNKANAGASDFVRGCCDMLRQIEGRLDHGCSSDWLERVDAVEDLVGVAQQLLPLQKLTAHNDSAQVSWLQANVGGGGAVSVDQQELSRRVIRLLDEVDKAVPPARNPSKISAFASAISSRLSKKPAWLSAMRVITAISGCAIALRALISPGAFMPISWTASTGVSGSAASVSGTPR